MLSDQTFYIKLKLKFARKEFILINLFQNGFFLVYRKIRIFKVSVGQTLFQGRTPGLP